MVALVMIQNVGNDGFDPKDVANISDSGTSNSNMFNKITTGNPTKKNRFGPFNHHTYLAHEAGIRGLLDTPIVGGMFAVLAVR